MFIIWFKSLLLKELHNNSIFTINPHNKISMADILRYIALLVKQ
ncbi:MAG: hypothetical protein JETT_2909 [Candidatus Jettenia ecosi]|uniref:Uncharacterized protein n=1 Tax=Candidatus Jettenia ecosi TaxID=2494326 RepID=A0A533Q9D0_9BACT|nr:MAG: hypothetical protein JETT_2909 [Candidatus Jettenia ecosi]